MPTQRLSIPGHSGAQLAAILDTPARPRAYALFAHCFSCSKDSRAAYAIGKALELHGIATLRFDFTGLGDSGGDFADTTFTSNVDDVVAAADYLAREYGAPQLLIGHSLGGAAVLRAAHRIEACRAVATIGAPFAPAHVLRHIEGAEEQLKRDGVAEVDLGGHRTVRIGQGFVDDVAGAELTDTIRGLRRALLVAHSPFDQVVGVANAGYIFDAALHPKTFLSLDHADHLLTDRADANWLAGVIAAWAERYIETAEQPAVSEDREWVEVRGGASGYLVDIAAGRHHFVADEPESFGGTDEGPTPYELLSAGLGACTAMTLRLYADRRGWPLTGSTVRLKYGRVHAQDCAACEESNEYIHRFQRELKLEGELSTEQRDKLREIADKCPVHKTLSEKIEVVTEVVD
jgi:uncharacterized OsmC-like protein/alpha/beta superfamily hydrolase